jgi:hypothetical protein
MPSLGAPFDRAEVLAAQHYSEEIRKGMQPGCILVETFVSFGEVEAALSTLAQGNQECGKKYPLARPA